MPLIELPHTAGCIVCGPGNPHGMRLSSYVDPATGTVQTTFIPAGHHIGFDDLVHGGVLATVLDEAMVWAAIWASKRACVAGEFGVRFRRKAVPGLPLTVSARVSRVRGKLYEVESTLTDAAAAQLVVAGTGKYLAGTVEETSAFLRTILPSEATRTAVDLLVTEANPEPVP